MHTCTFMWLPVGNLWAKSSCWGHLCLLTPSSGDQQHGGVVASLQPLLTMSWYCRVGKESGSGKQNVEITLIITSQGISLKIMWFFSWLQPYFSYFRCWAPGTPQSCNANGDQVGITVLLHWTWCSFNNFANCTMFHANQVEKSQAS